MAQLNPTAHVEIRIGPRGQRPFVAGHRVRVQDIVLWNEEGLAVDEIISRVPSLSLADVHAALAYYFDNREEIDRQISEDNEFASSMEQAELPRQRHQA